MKEGGGRRERLKPEEGRGKGREEGRGASKKAGQSHACLAGDKTLGAKVIM